MIQYTHIINKIYQQLNEHQTYAISNEYTTTKLNEDLAEQLQEES